MNEHLQHILRCPITKMTLREMNMNEVKEVNNRIIKGELQHFDGTLVKREIRSGFVSVNGQFLYPVEEGIVILLKNLGIVLKKDEADISSKHYLRKEKKDVQDFYDKIGWQKSEGELFVDALKYEDLRPVTKDYVHKCRLRVNRYLKPGGKYILDVASGPIQYPEYLTYSSGFQFRICVDISFLALKEARRNLGDKGIYLQADITNLPLKDNLVNAVVSLHTLYHVPEDEQDVALHEIYRVLLPGSSAVVVYSWGSHSFLSQVHAKIMRMLKVFFPKKTFKKASEVSGPKLYFHAHNYEYFTRQKWGFDLDILVWRSLNTAFTKKYIHNWLLGKQFLAFIYLLEDKFPYLTARLGQYPLFFIKK